jgi:anti-sigma regulatory factor (Ser/Thr protein kinase)
VSPSSVHVGGGRDAPSEARRIVAERLTGEVTERVLEDCGLLVSELVTNSVVHGHIGHERHVLLSIEVSGERVRVEVTDPGPGFATDTTTPGADEPGGFGLFLVTQVADAWGVSGDSDPTTVWFELRRG